MDPDNLRVSPKLVAFLPMNVTATEVAVAQAAPDVVVRVEVTSVEVDVPAQMPLPERADVGKKICGSPPLILMARLPLESVDETLQVSTSVTDCPDVKPLADEDRVNEAAPLAPLLL
jgi:hypothetical protein